MRAPRPDDDVWASRRRHPTAQARAPPCAALAAPSPALLGVITALNLLGLVMVLSASSVSALDTYGSSWYIAHAPGMWLVVGTVGLRRRACGVDYHRWRRWPCPRLAVTGVLLALVLVPGVGMNVNGASRWLGYGPFSLQPSELAKLTVLLFVGRPPGPPGGVDGRPAPHARARSASCSAASRCS